ncbi:hypothetical protein [Micromonospora sp. NPDC005324]|uniref:hypothetical protein n=1 Tax=Micromonospora sp. NPDC005324 TaxID=3157033 RepID=UPI0033ADA53C
MLDQAPDGVGVTGLGDPVGVEQRPLRRRQDGTGVFYESFATTAELQTKVAAKLRELDSAGNPLAFMPLPRPITVTWRSDFEARRGNAPSLPPAVELHVFPVTGTNRSARVMAELEQLLPARMRASGQVEGGRPTDLHSPGRRRGRHRSG